MHPGNNIALAVLLATLLPGTMLTAAPVPPPVQKEAAVYQLGVEWMSLHYKEPGAMREDGTLYGLQGAYRSRLAGCVLEVSSSLAAGTVRYNGMLMDGTPYKTDTENTLFDLRASLGSKRSMAGTTAVFTPYAGLGYRLLVDDLPPPYGYRREQSYVFMPVGIEVAGNYRSWAVGARIEYDVFLAGFNWSGGDSFVQDTGLGYKLSAYCRRPISERSTVSVSLEPFYQYWDIEESSASPTGYVEPANNCSTYGMALTVLF